MLHMIDTKNYIQNYYILEHIIESPSIGFREHPRTDYNKLKFAYGKWLCIPLCLFIPPHE